MSTPARMLTIPEVARLLRIGRTRAYRLAQTGIIPSVKLGRSVRVRPEDLAKLGPGPSRRDPA